MVFLFYKFWILQVNKESMMDWEHWPSWVQVNVIILNIHQMFKVIVGTRT